jgi:formate hydrogenlyase subunit 3/multisubunit Na+/H+ antiporter MnhD subunit
MQVSMMVLALASIVLGIFPNLIYPMLNGATDSILKILGGM